MFDNPSRAAALPASPRLECQHLLCLARAAVAVAVVLVVAGLSAAEDGGPSACPEAGYMPLTKEEILAEGLDIGRTHREPDRFEERSSLDREPILRPVDRIIHGIELESLVTVTLLDTDGDCLADLAEEELGTDPMDPDSDGDGWFDGPCNERRRLVLTAIKADDEQEDSGVDELYLVVDDIRFPNGDLDDYWDFDDGTSMSFNRTVAMRVRGKDTSAGLKTVAIEGWEDDHETWNEWVVDDLLFASNVDLGAHTHGDLITVACNEDDWAYTVVLELQVEHFSDPDPLADTDFDKDGIAESDESSLSRDLGGLADPTRAEIFVEVDAMDGHALHTNAKRLVTTQYFRHGHQVFIVRDDVLTKDPCLTVPEARNLYLSHFDHVGYDAFRYALITEELWNDSFGVAWRDTFMVDDSTWYIEDDVLAQSAAFLHELGHTVSLRRPTPGDNGPGTYKGIDTLAWFSYYSAMNYVFVATLTDYSYEGVGGYTDDHNDWEDIDPAWGLSSSFGLTASTATGICGN